MLTRRLLPFAALICLGLNGCYRKQEVTPSPYPFDNAPTKHRLNLVRLLGEEVVLASATDTIALRIGFEPATRISTITSPDNHLTTRGWVTRYRGAFYFTELLPDSTYYVHSWRRDRHTVQGLLDGYAQMTRLTEAIDQGRYPELTRRHAPDSTIHLRYEAQVLRPFYEAELARLPVYRRLKPEWPLTGRSATPPSVAAATALKPDTAPPATGLIRALYPNPAHTQVTVQLPDSMRGTLRLLGPDGTTVLTQPATATARLRVAALPIGTYTLHVQQAGTGRVAARRLVVRH